jgi:uncharacterized protein (DUF2236 family)
VAAGVADHSGFLADPFGRLRATLDATLRISFGDREQVQEAVARIGAVHRRVHGTLRCEVGPFPVGTPYDASDPELALWVHATLVSVAIQTYELFVEPLLSAGRERYYGEAGRFAELLGVSEEVLPPTYPAFLAYLRSMEKSGRIVIGDQARSLAERVLHPPVPSILRLSGPASRVVTAALLPDRIRRQFGLRFGIPERTILTAVGRTARVMVMTWPHRMRYWEHYVTASRRVVKSID